MAMARAKGSDTGGQGDTAPGVLGPESLGYEEARAALAETVAALESGDATLEEALALWEQGEEYARICEQWLAGAQARLTQEESLMPTSAEQPAPPSD